MSLIFRNQTSDFSSFCTLLHCRCCLGETSSTEVKVYNLVAFVRKNLHCWTFFHLLQIYDVCTHVLQRKFKSSIVIKIFYNNDMNAEWLHKVFSFYSALFANKEVTVFTKINNANRKITETTFSNAIEKYRIFVPAS